MKTSTLFSLQGAVKSLQATPIQALRAFCLGALFLASATVGARADCYPTNIVQLVTDKTTTLLAAPLTVSQRQVLHAQNFSQLPATARALYLHAVGYAISFAVAANGQTPSPVLLAQHLFSVPSIYIAPSIPPDRQLAFVTDMAIVKVALDELNLLIAGQIANNASFADAMRAGTVDGFLLE